MNSKELEFWLETAVNLFSKDCQQSNFVDCHWAFQSRFACLGVLDSVLRMLPRPHEILNQPERFSYFISPGPPADNIKRSSNSIEFDLNH